MECGQEGWRETSAEAATHLGIRFFLDREGRLRDRALFDLAIDSKLRGCDLVKIKIGTLVVGPEIRTRAIVVQQKTGRPVQFELMADTRASLLAWLERRGGTVDDYAFPSRINRSAPHEHAAVCPAGRRMGIGDRTALRRVWHTFAPANQSLDHL